MKKIYVIVEEGSEIVYAYSHKDDAEREIQHLYYKPHCDVSFDIVEINLYENKAMDYLADILKTNNTTQALNVVENLLENNGVLNYKDGQ